MSSPDAKGPAPRIAVVVPCYNEAATVETVVAEFRQALPEAEIHVFDNASSDSTGDVARRAGARVRHVALRGKGHVVRRLFADVEADVYLLVDGDATYSAPHASALVARVLEGHDMVVAVREATGAAAYRRGHVYGNLALTGFLSWLFGRPCRDILSGYRAFSRRFVKSFPVQSQGFEIETELTVHALELRMQVAEVNTPYAERPEGSSSKLSTWRDGFRILRAMLRLFALERPVHLYGAVSAVTLLLAIGLASPLAITYLQTGLVPRFPTAILVAAITIISVLSLLVGLVLDAVTRGRREAKALAYLRETGPGDAGEHPSPGR